MKCLVKGKVAGVVAGRICSDRNEMICGTMVEVDGVGGDGDVEGSYPGLICRRKWGS